MSAAPDCRHARLHIGAAPQHLPPEVTVHIATCADCSRFHGETLALDGRVRSALEVPLSRFRERAPPARPVVRRYALAASVVLALLVAGGFWFLNPQPALAGEVAEHVVHEAGSWDMREPLSADAVGEVLATGRRGFRQHDAGGLCHGLPVPRPTRAAPGGADCGRSVDRHAVAAREGGRAHGIFRTRIQRRVTAGGPGRRRGVVARGRRGAGKCRR